MTIPHPMDYGSPGLPDLEKLAELGRPSGHTIYTPVMSDQEIRAMALECAVRYVSDAQTAMTSEKLYAVAREFERHIRGGDDGR